MIVVLLVVIHLLRLESKHRVGGPLAHMVPYWAKMDPKVDSRRSFSILG